MARTAVTAFLVSVGLLVILFVEPPHRWLAVIEPVSPDRRPTWLALGLAAAFLAVLAVPPVRQLFNVHPLGLREAVVVALAIVGWTVLVWTFWRFRVVDRFLGVAAPPASDDGVGPDATGTVGTGAS